MKGLLTIGIPVFNGETKIRECLSTLRSVIEGFDVEVIVSDNHSTDNTLFEIRRIAPLFPKFRLLENDKNLGYDQNVFKIYQNAQTKFVWILGDDDGIEKTFFPILFRCLQEKSPDLVVVNASNRVKKFPSQEIFDGHLFVQRLGSHITFVSCSILKLEKIDLIGIRKYCDSCFVHVGTILELVAKPNFSSVYYDNNAIFPLGSNSMTYSSSFVFLFAKCIRNIGRLAPSFFSKKDLVQFYRGNNKILFPHHFWSVLSRRAHGCFPVSAIVKNISDIIVVFGFRIFIEILISLCLPPKAWMFFFKRVKRNLK